MSTPVLPLEINQPDLSAFWTAFPNFYKTNRFELWEGLFLGMFDANNPYNISDRFVMEDSINRPELLENIAIGNVIQRQDTDNINIKGNITMGGEILTPESWKIELLFDYVKQFKGYVQAKKLKRDNLVPSQENIIQDLHQRIIALIFKRGSADLRQAIYQGVKANNDNHLSFMNGLNKLMKDAAIASKHTPLAITVTSSSDVYPKIRQVVSQLGEAYRLSPSCIVKVAPDVYDFIREKQDGGGTMPTIIINSANRQAIADDIAATPLPSYKNVKVLEEPNLKAGGIVASVKENFVLGFDTTNPEAQMTMQPQGQKTYMVATGAVGVQVRSFSPHLGQKPFVCNELAVA